MRYEKTITLRDGRPCVLRSGTGQDGQALLELFILTHTQTDFLVDYPDEITMTAEQETQFLKGKAESENEVELLAVVDGRVVGSSGIWCVRDRAKLRHRAWFGVSVARDFWGLGIGRALTEAAVECAKAAGYRQLELEVLADNEKAIALYQSVGFAEYGRNPLGINLRGSGYHALALMRLELQACVCMQDGL